ncbi:MAG TPA: PIN domain nuclease [Candidatus Margulisiibacteriota bacterium]|nr:PIN domain nuclease [Candidatus Margulisiibacteriota bacterium]
MILVDTSAWIEFLRKSGHPVHLALKRLLQQRVPITTEVVIMEVLAGARAPTDHARLRALLLGMPRVRIKGLPDFEGAADLYRKCRRKGDTVRRLVDCLIATVAMREGAALLHNDRDYDVLARHSKLKIERVRVG